jgi:hypothetical protein
MIRCVAQAAVLFSVMIGPALARVLDVGPGQSYAAPSAAAADARDGDTISISPGTYYDCVLWRPSHLTIAASGPDVIITDRACAGKAAFVISGDDVTVRGLTLARIRVPDGNGAGIRAEGNSLIVEDSRFVNNQIAILAGGERGQIRITGCEFSANGVGLDGRQNHSVSVGALDGVVIERSVFHAARGGDHVSSAARRTELRDNHFFDEGGAMAGPLVLINGGDVTLEGNTVNLSAGAADRPGAFLVVGDATSLTVRGNTLIDPAGGVPLVRSWAGISAQEADNTVPPGSVAVSTWGTAYHRLRSTVASLRSQAHEAAGELRHEAAVLARLVRLIQ